MRDSFVSTIDIRGQRLGIGKIFSLLNIQTTPLIGWLHTDFLPEINHAGIMMDIHPFK
jgi:hypothetical protein